MIRKQVKRQSVKSVIGDKYSASEKEKHKKHNIWTMEDKDMIVSNARSFTIGEFQRELKNINPRLFIHYRKEIPLSPTEPFGHPIRFFDPLEESGYEFTGAAVGKGGNKIIPAMTTYNHYKNKDGDYETKIDIGGWEQALETVIVYLKTRNAKINIEFKK